MPSADSEVENPELAVHAGQLNNVAFFLTATGEWEPRPSSNAAPEQDERIRAVDINALPVDTAAGPVDVAVVESLRKYVGKSHRDSGSNSIR